MRTALLIIGLAACFDMPPRPQVRGGDAGTTDASQSDGNGGDGGLGTYNIVFASSVMVDGNLGGLSGADATCAELANASSLPGTYVAWLATSTASAFSRLGGARGWVRVDGLPVIDTVADLMADKMMYPIAIDDLGMAHYDETSHVMTGANAAGDATADTCNDYTSTAGSATVGETDGTSGNWTNDGVSLGCATKNRLYCFATDRAAELDPPAPPVGAKVAFVTNSVFKPGGGLAAADALCAAEAAVLNISAVALLATTTATAASRASAGVYARPDGVALGPIGNTLAAPINVTTTGAYISAPAWTGAASAAQPLTTVGTTATTCSNWSTASAASVGEVGAITVASPSSFYDRTASCNDVSTHLYCVQP